MKNLLANYFALQAEIHEAFGYAEDWCVFPMEDHSGEHWFVTDDAGGKVVWSPDEFTRESVEAGETIYSGEVYTQRFLSKWVYRAETHTMVLVDTRTDGNKILMIFDNDKECRDESLRGLYESCW